jgi:hypothetical protein
MVDLQDLAHGSRGREHRLFSSTTDVIEERVADATSPTSLLAGSSQGGQNPWNGVANKRRNQVAKPVESAASWRPVTEWRRERCERPRNMHRDRHEECREDPRERASTPTDRISWGANWDISWRLWPRGLPRAAEL